MAEIEEQLFRGFSDAMPMGVCLVDLEGRIAYWNTAAEGITGYLGAEVVGRKYRGDLLIHWEGGEAGAELQCPVKEVLRDGQAVSAELFLRHKEGHRVAVRVCAFALRDESGEMLGVGEIFDPAPGRQENAAWASHPDREFERAMGLPAVEESRKQLKTEVGTAAAPTAVILIAMQAQHAMLKHGGAAMLQQALRMLARTVAGLLPARHYVGCWSDWRLIAIIPECDTETLEKVKAKLAGVGSSGAVKWWGDRVSVEIRTAARYVNAGQTVDTLIEGMEQELKSATDRSE
jgi:PAS domain S-box-containing protein